MAPARRQTLVSATLIALAAFFLLAGYEFIRSASNTLFKEAYTPARLPVIMALTPLGVVAALVVYGRLLSRLGPRRTLLVTSLASGLGIFAATRAALAGWAPATGVLYVVREAYIVLLIEQYWSFLNSTLGDNMARKLNGPITGVASLGSFIGGHLVESFVHRLGTGATPMIAGALCIPAALYSELAYRVSGEPEPGSLEEKRSHDELGLRLFTRSRLLVLLLLVVVATQVISGMLEWRFQFALSDAFPKDSNAQTAYSGHFYGKVALISALLQFVVAPILLRWLPLVIVHAAMPCIHIISGAVLLRSPSLATAGMSLLLFKCFDYSIFRAAKELLYIPLSFDARYRAKEVIDVLGCRFAKGAAALAAALLVGAGLKAEHFSVMAATGAAVLWLALVFPLMRAREKRPGD